MVGVAKYGVGQDSKQLLKLSYHEREISVDAPRNQRMSLPLNALRAAKMTTTSFATLSCLQFLPLLPRDPDLTQTRPVLDPYFTQTTRTRPVLDPYLTQTRPKPDPNSIQTRPKLDPNSTQTRPGLDPDSTQTRSVLDPYSTRT